jgi:hypothetical protein
MNNLVSIKEISSHKENARPRWFCSKLLPKRIVMCAGYQTQDVVCVKASALSPSHTTALCQKVKEEII